MDSLERFHDVLCQALDAAEAGAGSADIVARLRSLCVKQGAGADAEARRLSAARDLLLTLLGIAVRKAPLWAEQLAVPEVLNAALGWCGAADSPDEPLRRRRLVAATRLLDATVRQPGGCAAAMAAEGDAVGVLIDAAAFFLGPCAQEGPTHPAAAAAAVGATAAAAAAIAPCLAGLLAEPGPICTLEIRSATASLVALTFEGGANTRFRAALACRSASAAQLARLARPYAGCDLLGTATRALEAAGEGRQEAEAQQARQQQARDGGSAAVQAAAECARRGWVGGHRRECSGVRL
ncbi:MAG: hypothetical protein J3K34DRAFT_521608 [Monoraphidium minutum]|nr:MAG: hypothetical protein J3K34DRAFT_521608 [Monoraphidium minutum]